MGFQDRDYYREANYYRQSQDRGHSAIFWIIVINAVIWLLDGMNQGQLSNWFALRVGDFVQPTQWYRFLTAGFCHARQVWHVAGNMLGLFFLGRAIEARYGKREFLFFYLIAVVVGNVYWAGTNYYALYTMRDMLTEVQLYHGLYSTVVGASGAVTAIIILFAMNFPRVMIYIWGLLPLPAFVFGILLVLMDLFGTQNQETNVAHSVHLAGAAFAFLYFITKFRFCYVFGYGNNRVQAWSGNAQAYSNYDPERDYEDDYEDDSYGYAPPSSSAEELQRNEEMRRLQAEVDELLKKISQYGMQSLTPQELERLRTASQKFRTRR